MNCGSISILTKKHFLLFTCRKYANDAHCLVIYAVHFEFKLHQENMKSACDPLSKAYAPLDARKAFKSAKKVRSLIGLGLLPYQSR